MDAVNYEQTFHLCINSKAQILFRVLLFKNLSFDRSEAAANPPIAVMFWLSNLLHPLSQDNGLAVIFSPQT